MKSQVAMPDGSVIQGVAVVSKSGIALPTLGTDGFGRLQISQANSVAEFDTAATAISGGTSIAKGFVVSGAGAAAIVTNGALDIRSPLVLSQIDAALISQVPVSIVATAFAGTSNLSAVMNWQEQTV